MLRAKRARVWRPCRRPSRTATASGRARPRAQRARTCRRESRSRSMACPSESHASARMRGRTRPWTPHTGLPLTAPTSARRSSEGAGGRWTGGRRAPRPNEERKNGEPLHRVDSLQRPVCLLGGASDRCRTKTGSWPAKTRRWTGSARCAPGAVRTLPPEHCGWSIQPLSHS